MRKTHVHHLDAGSKADAEHASKRTSARENSKDKAAFDAINVRSKPSQNTHALHVTTSKENTSVDDVRDGNDDTRSGKVPGTFGPYRPPAEDTNQWLKHMDGSHTDYVTIPDEDDIDTVGDDETKAVSSHGTPNSTKNSLPDNYKNKRSISGNVAAATRSTKKRGDGEMSENSILGRLTADNTIEEIDETCKRYTLLFTLKNHEHNSPKPVKFSSCPCLSTGIRAGCSNLRELSASFWSRVVSVSISRISLSRQEKYP